MIETYSALWTWSNFAHIGEWQMRVVHLETVFHHPKNDTSTLFSSGLIFLLNMFLSSKWNLFLHVSISEKTSTCVQWKFTSRIQKFMFLLLFADLFCKDVSGLVTAIYSHEWGEILMKQICKWMQRNELWKFVCIKLFIEHSAICDFRIYLICSWFKHILFYHTLKMDWTRQNATTRSFQRPVVYVCRDFLLCCSCCQAFFSNHSPLVRSRIIIFFPESMTRIISPRHGIFLSNISTEWTSKNVQ